MQQKCMFDSNWRHFVASPIARGDNGDYSVEDKKRMKKYEVQNKQ